MYTIMTPGVSLRLKHHDTCTAEHVVVVLVVLNVSGVTSVANCVRDTKLHSVLQTPPSYFTKLRAFIIQL